MSKFNNSKVYGIYEGNILQYIGYTTQRLSDRFYEHCVSNDSKISKYIRLKGKCNFRVELIENWNCDTYNQIAYRERYWIELLNPPLNIQRPSMNLCLPPLPKSLPLDINEIPPPLPTTPIPTF